MQDFHAEIQKIHERNRRVEADKAWEVSWFRILLVAAFIYIVAAFFMLSIEIKDAWLNALVPPVAYVLSEQSLPIIKRWWIKHRYKQ